ncbi:MAG TPA: VWA domain-containing protein, partial [Pseudorhodoplanes sp.]|nr:VWA domain-containing protein [Pseudorhodoplanes sp.]
MSKDRPDASAPVGRREPAAKGSKGTLQPESSRRDIDAFLDQVRSLGPAREAGQRGRLIFALDATMSRQPTWDTACQLQADMFREAGAIGGLDVQLV